MSSWAGYFSRLAMVDPRSPCAPYYIVYYYIHEIPLGAPFHSFWSLVKLSILTVHQTLCHVRRCFPSIHVGQTLIVIFEPCYIHDILSGPVSKDILVMHFLKNPSVLKKLLSMGSNFSVLTLTLTFTLASAFL